VINSPNESGSSPQHNTVRTAYQRLRFPDQVGDFDLACPGCGYNLRGLATIGRCPECGNPVWAGFLARKLALFSPDLLAELVKGQMWLRLAGWSAAITSALSLPAYGAIPVSFALGITAIGGTLTLAALCIAMWKFSTPNPGDDAPNRERIAHISRIALLATATGSAAAVAIAAVWGFGPTATAIAILTSPLGVTGGVFLILQARVIERLATLAEDSFGAQRALVYRRAFSVSWSLFLLSMVFTIWFPNGGACPGLLSGVAALGFAILIVASPVYFVAHLEAARKLADLLRTHPDAVLAATLSETDGERRA
jgi:hypothetical protein